MTDKELIERARELNQSVPSDWRAQGRSVYNGDPEHGWVVCDHDTAPTPAEAVFIAESRTILPALATALEASTAKLARIEAEVLPETIGAIAERAALGNLWAETHERERAEEAEADRATLLDAVRVQQAELDRATEIIDERIAEADKWHAKWKHAKADAVADRTEIERLQNAGEAARSEVAALTERLRVAEEGRAADTREYSAESIQQHNEWMNKRAEFYATIERVSKERDAEKERADRLAEGIAAYRRGRSFSHDNEDSLLAWERKHGGLAK